MRWAQGPGLDGLCGNQALHVRSQHGTRLVQSGKRTGHLLAGRHKIKIGGLKLTEMTKFSSRCDMIKKISEKCPGRNKCKYPRKSDASLTKLL